jgi:tRNA dimethylallyltransferase
MDRRIVAIVGATASGKTALALELATHQPGRFEVINADSRQVYRGMDIGTAKPTVEERVSVMHHIIDVVDPDEPFSLGTWLNLAREAADEVWRRDRTPLLVGGTGQYVWALLEGWQVPRVPPQSDLRATLEARPPAELLAELAEIDPETHALTQPNNVRRIIRALEVYQATGKPLSYWRQKEPPDFEFAVLAVDIDRTALYDQIDRRVDAMIEAGFVVEVESLLAAGYGPELPSMSSIGYREMCGYLAGAISLDQATVRTKTGTHRLARHQNAWFKRTHDRIQWFRPDERAEAVRSVEQFID